MVLFLRNKRFNVTLFFVWLPIEVVENGDYQLKSMHAAKQITVAVIKLIEDYLQSALPPTTREGVQSSSNSNHRHPNLFWGKLAPQLVISTTSKLVITVKFCFLWFALLTQFTTSIGVSWHLYWLKLNFQIIFRFVWSTKTENQGTVHFGRILDPIRHFNDCISWLASRYKKGRAACLLKIISSHPK